VLRLEDIGQEADFWGRSKLRTKESKKALVVEIRMFSELCLCLNLALESES
jgi:hypothetical protein